VSSSTSIPDACVAGLLDESLEVLQREQPASYARLCEALATLRIEIGVDGEWMIAGFESGSHRVAAQSAAAQTAPASARFRASRGAVLDVLDGRISLAEAVLAGRLEAYAPLARLLELHDALVLYVNAAVRCPSFPALLDRFRAGAAAAERSADGS
jgi:hypothetical protein